MLSPFTLLTTLLCTVASASTFNPSALITSTPTPSLLTQTYDYIIIGSGPSGSTIARRLAESASNINVLLFEAGQDVRTDPRCIRVTEDWDPIYNDNASTLNYFIESTPQKFVEGRKRKSHWAFRGFGGGTSGNGGLFDLPDLEQIDSWKQLGLPDWNGQAVLDAARKMQNFHPPQGRAKRFGATAVPVRHDTDGPVNISFPGSMYSTGQQAVKKAVQAVFQLGQVRDPGAPKIPPSGWQFNSFYIIPDESSETDNNVTSQLLRSSAATGYISPLEDRESAQKNLKVLLNTSATQIIFSPAQGNGEALQAAGVTAQQTQDGRILNFKARREVIVAAGTFKSPILLELSGIGDKDILSKINVSQLIDLPGVGKHYVDKIGMFIVRPMKPGYESLQPDGNTPAELYLPIDKLCTNASEMHASVMPSLPETARRSVALGGGASEAGLLRIMQAQTKGIFEDGWPVEEYQIETHKNSSALQLKCNMFMPFSRGSVHASTKDAIFNKDSVQIDSLFFSQSIDRDFQVAAARMARKLLGSKILQDLFTGNESVPGYNRMPTDAAWGYPGVPDDDDHGSYADWSRMIDAAFFPESHSIGTCAMMNRDLGGVVDSDFRVYGTSNVRVVDASVMPYELSIHPTGTLYGMGELAAEKIVQANRAGKVYGRSSGVGS